MLERKEHTAVAVLDLSKAFNSMDHGMLLSKLTSVGICEQGIAIMKQCLQNRFRRVKNGNLVSDWRHVSKGVPQGTVLGPLLFSLYVYDLHKALSCTTTTQYADDTCIFVSRVDPHAAAQLVEQAAERAVCYFRKHQLNINVSKTDFMVVRRPHQDRTVSDVSLIVEDKIIFQNTYAKYLGVLTENHLSFDIQVKELILLRNC